ERQSPRRVHAAAERREDAEAPVPDLVPEALHHDRPVRRDRAGGAFLLAQEGEEVRGGALVQRVLVAEPGRCLLVGERPPPPRGGADRPPELVRPAAPFALPERHRARHARRRRDEHAVARDLLDPPRRGAEQERLPLASLVDHLLVGVAGRRHSRKTTPSSGSPTRPPPSTRCTP